MCDFIARTNWLNIKSNYFVHTIIIFNLSYYTNITITVTLMNHLTLCRALFLFFPKYYPHKSCTIFHINLYVFNIYTEIPNGTNKLNHVKRSAVFQNKPFGIPYSRMNHFAMTGISVCSRLFKTPFTTVMLNGILLLMKGSSLTNWSLFPSFFFDLVWQMMLLSLTALFEWGTMVLWMRVVPPARSSLSKSMKHSSHGNSNRVKMQTPAITLWFLEQCLLGFFILEKQLTSQDMFLIRSELSITAYLFLVLYRSTSCHKPPRYVPYKGTYVSYDGTFGMPDQGQMLNVWESQTAKSALRNDWPRIVPRHMSI
jgi:hypothetical protein